MRANVIEVDRHEDERGWLIKVLMRHQIAGNRDFGEIYVCSSRPGQVRAHHYHEKTTEWFCVTAGHGRLLLQDVDSGETQCVGMNSDAPCVVMIPPRIAHAVENTGATDLCLLAYADTPYDPAAPDTRRYRVRFASQGRSVDVLGPKSAHPLASANG